MDEPNRLHFYVLEKAIQEGALTYGVAVRSLDGGGPFARGVSLKAARARHASPGRVGVYTFKVTNSGTGPDLFRLKARTDQGWKLYLPHEVIEVETGETRKVKVFVAIPTGASSLASLELEVTSETDTTATATASRTARPRL